MPSGRGLERSVGVESRQPVEPGAVASAARERIDRFKRKVRRENDVQIAGCFILIPVAAWFAVTEPSVVSRIGFLMLAAASGAVGALTARMAGLPADVPEANGSIVSLVAHARECYEKRIGFLTFEHRLALPLLVPGMIMTIAGYQDAATWIKVLASTALVLIVGFGMWLNLVTSAGKLKKELAEIEGLITIAEQEAGQAQRSA